MQLDLRGEFNPGDASATLLANLRGGRLVERNDVLGMELTRTQRWLGELAAGRAMLEPEPEPLIGSEITKPWNS